MYSRRSGCNRRCGVVFFLHRDHYPTPTRQRDDGTQLGPGRRRRGVCRRSLSGEPDVENVDVAEILLQDGGHTMPTTGLGRPAVSVAVVPRSLSATHVWIESASQRRHSAESRSGAAQDFLSGYEKDSETIPHGECATRGPIFGFVCATLCALATLACSPG